MTRSIVSPRPLTGRMVLFSLLTFFGVVIGVNVIMMRLAIQTLPGTDVDSAAFVRLNFATSPDMVDVILHRLPRTCS